MAVDVRFGSPALPGAFTVTTSTFGDVRLGSSSFPSSPTHGTLAPNKPTSGGIQPSGHWRRYRNREPLGLLSPHSRFRQHPNEFVDLEWLGGRPRRDDLS